MSYDKSCWNLADDWLGDPAYVFRDPPAVVKKAATDRLAQAIQDAIENELESLRLDGIFEEMP